MRGRARARAATISFACVALASAPAGTAAETLEAEDTTFALSRRVDPEGLSLLRETRRRSPTGFLYPYPFEPPEGTALGEGWSVRGFAEVGWQESWGGSEEAYFEEYGDLRDGVIDATRVELRHAPSGFYSELGAQALGRDDASAFLEAGQPGRLRIRGFYEALPHRYANDARVLFDGVGSEQLTLPAPLVPGGNPDAAIDAALAGRPDERLALEREKAGVALRFQASPLVALRAGYRVEQRDGERPFGGAIRFAFQSPNQGSVVETIEPLDARTHDFHGGLSLVDERIHMELDYEGSVFDNRSESLTWDNPFPGTNVDRGRFALAPDNHQHRLHGTASLPLGDRGRWTNTASWISSRQDERLLAPTINDAAAFADWVDPAMSLSRDRARARVDTTLLASTLRLSPWRRLALAGSVRWRRRDNDTSWVALNPSTGAFGYVIEDGSFGIRPRYAALPYEDEQLELEASATARLPFASSLTLEAERERIRREQRARGTTEEDRGRVSLSTRGLPRTTLRLAYEIAERDGSSTRRGRDAYFYSVGPPDFAPPPIGTPQRSLTSFEQHDLADRTAHDASARLSFQLWEIADLAFAGGLRKEDYDLRHGLREAASASANAELTVQPAPAWDAYAFAGAEWRKRELDTIDSASFLGSDFAPGGPVFPLDLSWGARTRTRALSVGGGASARPHALLELRADYQLLASRERLAYDYAGPDALAPGTTPADAGSRFPHLENVDHLLDVSARVDLGEHLAVRALYRFQHSTIANFYQEGLVPRIGRALYLGHVDGDFTAHVVGGSLQARF